MKLETGICGEQSVRVSAENTAKTMGSGTLDVFATPALVALAEKTCWQSVAPALEAGSGTVGTKLELEHTAPTPVGMTVTCHSELVAVEGRKLTFKVTLADEKGPVGGGSQKGLRVAFICFVQPQRRQVCSQQLLLGAGLRILQKLHSLHTGAEQLKVHGLVIRHGAHPPCVSVGSLPRSLRPDTPERFRRQ